MRHEKQRKFGILDTTFAPVAALVWNLLLAYLAYFIARLAYLLVNLGHFADGLTFNHLLHLFKGGLAFDTSAIIYTNASDEPVSLKMKGVVVEDLVDYSNRYPYDMEGLLASVNNVEFDDVKKGETREVEINLLNNTDHDMTPNMLHLPSYLHALAMPEVLEPNRSGKIILTLNSEEVKQYGLTQVSIYLAKRLGEKISNETELPVSVVLLPDMKQFEGVNREQAPQLQLSADALNLDAHHKNGTIILTNSGKTALNITSLQMFTGGLKVKLPKSTLQPGESTKLRVTIIPSQIRKARSKPRILMITNDPEHAKVVININVE